jgi:hypothetical protein
MTWEPAPNGEEGAKLIKKVSQIQRVVNEVVKEMTPGE